MTSVPNDGAPQLPPQVIKRGDEFVVLNVNLDELSDVQRAAVGHLVWEQVKYLMGENGEPNTSPLDVDRRVGPIVKSSYSAIRYTRGAIRKRPKLLKRMLNNEFASIIAVERHAGYKHGVNPTRRYLGSGDPFDDATALFLQYLKVWEGREFSFPHVNHREAKRRLHHLRKIERGVQEIIKDMEMRSHAATLSVPSWKGKEKGKK